MMRKPFMLGESAVALYDWFDVEEGTGMVNYYGCCVNTGTTNYSYILTRNTALYSCGIPNTVFKLGKTVTTGVHETTTDVEFNFDLLFNMPQNLQGNFYFNLCANAMATNPGSHIKFLIRVLHVDAAAAETAISSQITTDEITNAEADYPVFCVRVPITAKHFKKGETLRCEIIQRVYLSTNSTSFTLWHSPVGQDATPTTSKLIVSVPFKIDIG